MVNGQDAFFERPHGFFAKMRIREPPPDAGGQRAGLARVQEAATPLASR